MLSGTWTGTVPSIGRERQLPQLVVRCDDLSAGAPDLPWGAPFTSTEPVVAGSIGMVSVWAKMIPMDGDGTEFQIEAAPEAREVFDEIKTEMMLLFGIEKAEAVGRIDRFWEGQRFITKEQLLYLLHDNREEHWAKTIWYGRDSFWWAKDEATLQPTPWP